MTPRLYPLSPRQREILDLIPTLTRERGIPPSFGEIGERLGIHVSRVRQIAISLQRRGLVVREPRVARSLRLASPTAPAADRPTARTKRGR
jgi:SOS-response transcriptional repressor LexA